MAKLPNVANETSIQNALWQMELGGGKRIIRWILVVLVAVTLGLIYSASEFRGLNNAEAMDMAQLARNIARGQGFTTYIIRPLSLWHLKEYGPDHEQRLMNHPDLYNPPLYPLVLAGLFQLAPESVFQFDVQKERVFTPERWIILPFNQVCLLLCVLLVYFWAKQLFDKRVAVMAGLLLLFSDTLWSFGISGLPSSFLMLLWLTSLYCLFRADCALNPSQPVTLAENKTAPASPARTRLGMALTITSAVLLGLCFLTRYMTGFLLIPMAFYVSRIWRGRRGWVMAGLFAAIFLVIITPWLVRNYHISHSVLGIAKYQWSTGELAQRTYRVNPDDFGGLKDLARRILTVGRAQLFDNFKRVGGDFLIFFFVVGWLYGFRRPEVRRQRGIVIAGLAFAILAVIVCNPLEERVDPGVAGSNLLILFVPLIAVYGVAFFYLLLDRIPFRMRLTQGLAVGFFGFVNVLPIILTLLPPQRSPFPYPPYIAPYTRLIAGWFDADDVGTCDQPWSMAWVGDRRTIWLPNTIDEFTEIHDFVAPKNTKFLFLTPYMLNRAYESQLVQGEYKYWFSLSRGQIPKDFPLKAGTLMPPENQQLLLADRVRWASQQPEPAKQPEPTAGTTNAPPAEAAP